MLIDCSSLNQLEGQSLTIPVSNFLIRLFLSVVPTPKCGQHLLVTAQIKGHKSFAFHLISFILIGKFVCCCSVPSLILLTPTREKNLLFQASGVDWRSALLWESCKSSVLDQDCFCQVFVCLFVCSYHTNRNKAWTIYNVWLVLRNYKCPWPVLVIQMKMQLNSDSTWMLMKGEQRDVFD